jgi:hypothetical protein
MRYLPQAIRSDFDWKNQVDRLRKVYSSISFGQVTDNTDAGQNITGQWVTGTSPATANTEFNITVNLGYIPVGFDVKRQSLAASFYDSGTAWTSSKIYLKCSVASVKYTLFIH